MGKEGTIQSWFERYMLEHHDAIGNDETYKGTVRCVLKRYLIEEYGDMDAELFGVQEARNTMRAVEENSEVGSQAYADHIHGWAKHLFSYIMEHGGTAMNPYDQVDKPMIVNIKC